MAPDFCSVQYIISSAKCCGYCMPVNERLQWRNSIKIEWWPSWRRTQNRLSPNESSVQRIREQRLLLIQQTWIVHTVFAYFAQIKNTLHADRFWESTFHMSLLKAHWKGTEQYKLTRYVWSCQRLHAQQQHQQPTTLQTLKKHAWKGKEDVMEKKYEMRNHNGSLLIAHRHMQTDTIVYFGIRHAEHQLLLYCLCAYPIQRWLIEGAETGFGFFFPPFGIDRADRKQNKKENRIGDLTSIFVSYNLVIKKIAHVKRIHGKGATGD